ncbi:hypothetical protein DAQ1742_01826 [Dickeya aquatica]|uniref:Uncharacterized protein n=1 Tax=Dickeya aquatica TaxID=1401087 RepID=A0A375A9P1_9GAMM|nr:hypothetical protein DAQ1742_01826 [Dickeya aquatica]
MLFFYTFRFKIAETIMLQGGSHFVSSFIFCSGKVCFIC